MTKRRFFTVAALMVAIPMGLAVAANAAPVMLHFDDFSTDTMTDTLTSPYNTSAGTVDRPAYSSTNEGVPLAGDPGGQTITPVTGRVNVVNPEAPAAVTMKNAVGSFDDYGVYEVSVFVRRQFDGTAAPNARNNAAVGLMNVDNGVLAAGGTAANRAGWQIALNETASAFTLRIQPIVANVFATQVISQELVPVPEEDYFFKLTSRFTRNLDGTFDVVAELWRYDLAVDGSPRPGWYNPTLVLDVSATGMSVAGIEADTLLYAGFGIRSRLAGRAGFDAADNFAVLGIPEPASLAMLALGGVLLGLRRRQA